MKPASKEVEVLRDPTYPIITSPAEMRTMARRGEWHGSTGGQCPGYEQANLVILPKDAAIEFAAFCTRNPKPCPLIEITPPGDQLGVDLYQLAMGPLTASAVGKPWTALA